MNTSCTCSKIFRMKSTFKEVFSCGNVKLGAFNPTWRSHCGKQIKGLRNMSLHISICKTVPYETKHNNYYLHTKTEPGFQVSSLCYKSNSWENHLKKQHNIVLKDVEILRRETCRKENEKNISSKWCGAWKPGCTAVAVARRRRSVHALLWLPPLSACA